MTLHLLENAVIWFIPVVLSLTVHEWAHAASANALGDDTAKLQGRLTLNPLPHVDLLGTVILPILQLVTYGGVLFAWAKPVPINPVRFSRRVSMRTGDVLVSAAGPASNLVIALAAAIGMGISIRLGVMDGPMIFMLQSLLGLNLALAIFNLLPIPPLDGSHVLKGLLPRKSAAVYEQIYPYAPFLLMAVMVFGGHLIMWPMGVAKGWMWHVTAMVAG